MEMKMAGPDPSRPKGVGAYLHEANVFVFEKNKKATSIVGAILIILLTFFVFKMEADSIDDVLGADDIKALIAKGGFGPDGPGLEIIEGYELVSETLGESGQLSEGGSDKITIAANEEKVIGRINVSLTWKDEPDQRWGIRYWENTGDTFQVEITDPEGNVLETASGTNSHGSDGSLDLSLSLNATQIESFYGKGEMAVIITLTDAGDYEARVGIGFLVRTDDENGYSVQVEVSYYQPAEEE